MYKPMKLIPIVALLATAALPLHAQEEEAPVVDEDAVRCLNLRMVRRTDVVDDRNILFYMRGGDVYHNILPRACSGLAREDRFSYKTSLGKLCQIDNIRVLYDDPFGLREGISCSLGYFHKISEEDAKALQEGVGKGPEAAPLPMPEPGEVGDEDDTDTPEPEPRQDG